MKGQRTSLKSMPAWSHWAAPLPYLSQEPSIQTNRPKKQHRGEATIFQSIFALQNTFCQEKGGVKEAINTLSPSPSVQDCRQSLTELEFSRHCLHARAIHCKHILKEGRAVIGTAAKKKRKCCQK